MTKDDDLLKQSIGGLFVRGALALDGKPLSRKHAMELLEQAALCEDRDASRLLLLKARLFMRGALANETKGVKIKGRPRRKSVNRPIARR